MSSVPSLLESLARNPYGDEDFARAVAQLEPSLREALLVADVAGLVAALDGRAVMACFVAAPDQEEPLQEEHPVRDEPAPEDAPDSSTP